jgi:hypothetical protein
MSYSNSLNLDICSSNNSNANINVPNDGKKYSYKDLENLKNKISSLSDSHHNFILKIICDNEVHFSENSNGCFINLLNVPNNVLVEIEQYVNFLIEKEKHLEEVETLKKSLQTNIEQ